MNIRTNNRCEGYNKRAGKSHLNIYELILVFKSDYGWGKSAAVNKSAAAINRLIFFWFFQLEGGQQAAKRRKRYDEIDSRLYFLGLKYMLLEIDLESYVKQCSYSICGNFQKK